MSAAGFLRRIFRSLVASPKLHERVFRRSVCAIRTSLFHVGQPSNCSTRAYAVFVVILYVAMKDLEKRCKQQRRSQAILGLHDILQFHVRCLKRAIYILNVNVARKFLKVFPQRATFRMLGCRKRIFTYRYAV